MSEQFIELYIHIPFCVRKCLYCDFLSFAADDVTKEKYVDALCRELECMGEERRDASLSSVFIGGGTPSVLPADHIRRIMDCVRESFCLQSDAEITIECNPGTVTDEKLRTYRECGINRISFGLQSIHDDELKTLGRIHSFGDFLAGYRSAVNAGFTNINVDLMSGCPGQTEGSWRETLEKVCSLDPAPVHISAYSLIVEDGTPFGEMYEDGDLILPDEDTDRSMYHLTSEILSHYGYERYEISNYSKKGFECRHNKGYWTGTEYFGAGLDAASYLDKKRYVNTSDMDSYLRDPAGVRVLVESLGKSDLMGEFMILGLRLTKGVSGSEFTERFGADIHDIYGKEIARFVKEGLLEEEGGYIRLTERGLDLANRVMQAFI